LERTGKNRTEPLGLSKKKITENFASVRGLGTPTVSKKRKKEREKRQSRKK